MPCQFCGDLRFRHADRAHSGAAAMDSPALNAVVDGDLVGVSMGNNVRAGTTRRIPAGRARTAIACSDFIGCTMLFA